MLEVYFFSSIATLKTSLPYSNTPFDVIPSVDSFNAIMLKGDAVRDLMFYGRGAGEMPTASAVVGDILDVARNMQYGCMGRIGCGCYKELPVKEFGEVKNRFFLRMQVTNEPGVLAQIAKVFGDHKVSIERVVQREAKKMHALAKSTV